MCSFSILARCFYILLNHFGPCYECLCLLSFAVARLSTAPQLRTVFLLPWLQPSSYPLLVRPATLTTLAKPVLIYKQKEDDSSRLLWITWTGSPARHVPSYAQDSTSLVSVIDCATRNRLFLPSHNPPPINQTDRRNCSSVQLKTCRMSLNYVRGYHDNLAARKKIQRKIHGVMYDSRCYYVGLMNMF